MTAILTKIGQWIFLPGLVVLGGIWAISWLFLPPEEQMGGPVALGIILAAVVPIVFAALCTGQDFQTRAIILLGGSIGKLIMIVLLVMVVRRLQFPFADKNSFLIWLFLSYLILSSLGWFVVAVQVPTGRNSTGSGHR